MAVVRMARKVETRAARVGVMVEATVAGQVLARAVVVKVVVVRAVAARVAVVLPYQNRHSHLEPTTSRTARITANRGARSVSVARRLSWRGFKQRYCRLESN